MKIMFRVVLIGVSLGLFFANVVLCQNEAPAIVKKATLPNSQCVLGEKADAYPFYVYKDYKSPENKFFSTGNMGDYFDVQVQLNDTVHKYSGTSCVQIVYKLGELQGAGWAGLFWQYPANNWGGAPGGYDLSGAKRLTFWARGEKGGEVINTFQVGGIHGKYSDSGLASISKVVLSANWEKYTIDLSDIGNSIIIDEYNKECWPFMAPLSRITGGFGWATSLFANNGGGVTFYLDEIRFEND
jgi:hypothetical protein